MGILDQIMQMKSQGISDEEIVSELSQQGISPRQINDALKQAQIKSVVSNGYGNDGDMQASMMPGEEPPAPEQETYQPAYQPQQQSAPQEEAYQPQMQQGQEQAYQAGGYEQYAPAGIDTDTVMEIADQIFSDRIKKFQKQLDSVTETSTLLQTKMENISERFKRIEAIIDKLQLAILEKVGSYGRNLDSIKKEMSMMQDSFSKMISPSRKSERQQREEYSAPEKSNEELEEETPEENEEEEETPQERKKIVSRPQKKISKKR